MPSDLMAFYELLMQILGYLAIVFGYLTLATGIFAIPYMIYKELFRIKN